MTIPSLVLAKDQDRRIRAGHAWVFSNEVDTNKSALQQFSPGEPVAILNAQGHWIANGYVNPHSLICARVISRNPKVWLDAALLKERLTAALRLRERLYPQPFYRLVYGESDLLPGLIVDRYGNYLAVQITTAGMERQRDALLETLIALLRPSGIILRNDTPARAQEGLPEGIDIVFGEIPERVSLEEASCRFAVDLQQGQKTGWFYDQADNRAQLAAYATDATMLDVCSYTGAWTVRALAAGATHVTAIDVSANALEHLQYNAALNGYAEKVTTLQGDAFDQLKRLREQHAQFDLVNLDPPAFIKRKKDSKAGADAYRRLNQLGLELVKPGGMLVTSSCSFHFGEDQLQQVVRQAANKLQCAVQLLRRGQQASDHPVHPAIAETAYLKTLFVHKMETSN